MGLNDNLLFSEFGHHQFPMARLLGDAGWFAGPLPILLAVSVIVLIILFLYLRPRWKAMRARIDLVCTSGYLPDPPTEAEDRKMRKVSRIAVWLQIGKVKWSGLENLNCGNPKLVIPTHGHYLDPFVIAAKMPKGSRVISARGLFRAGWGLGGLVFSRWGAFCTDLEPGKGLPALRSGVKVLSSGQLLVIFAEGWAHMDGVVGPFNPGVASIAHLVERKTNNPVYIVPVYMRYKRYPGKWINRYSTSIQCLILMFGFFRYRRGVHVVIGEPLLSSDLPKDSRAAAEHIRNAVLAQDPLLKEQAVNA